MTITILTVDDEPVQRRLAGEVLVRAGYRVVEAENGQEALDRLGSAETTVDLVLLDLMMPGWTVSRLWLRCASAASNSPSSSSRRRAA